MTNVTIRYCSEVLAAIGDQRLEGVAIRDTKTNQNETLQTTRLFVLIGSQPRTEWLPPTVNRDQWDSSSLAGRPGPTQPPVLRRACGCLRCGRRSPRIDQTRRFRGGRGRSSSTRSTNTSPCSTTHGSGPPSAIARARKLRGRGCCRSPAGSIAARWAVSRPARSVAGRGGRRAVFLKEVISSHHCQLWR